MTKCPFCDAELVEERREIEKGVCGPAVPVVSVNAYGQGVDSLYFRKHLCTA